MTTRYVGSYSGIGQIMRSEDMQELVRQVAEKAMGFAVELAPVGDPRTDPHPGEYKASFEVQVSADGGLRNDRAEAILVNTADHAVDVEYKDGHLVLNRTLAALESL